MYANYKLEHKTPVAIIYALFLHLLYNDLEVHCLRGASSQSNARSKWEEETKQSFLLNATLRY